MLSLKWKISAADRLSFSDCFISLSFTYNRISTNFIKIQPFPDQKLTEQGNVCL